MIHQIQLLLDDSLMHYKRRNLKKALNAALIALEFGKNGTYQNDMLVKAYLLLANIFNTNGRYQNEPTFFTKAIDSLNEAKAVNQKSPDPLASTEIFITEGKIHLNLKKFKEARLCFENAIELAKQHSLFELQVIAFAFLGQVCLGLNDPVGGYDIAVEIESLVNEVKGSDNLSAKAQMCLLFSQSSILQQDYSRSLQMSQELLQVSRKLGDVEKEAIALRNIAVVCGVKSNYKIGMQYFLEALDKCETIGFREMIVQIQINIGTLYAHLYNYDEAIRRYQNVIDKHHDVLDAKTQTVVYNNLGNIYLISEHTQIAMEYFEKAHQLAKVNRFSDLEAYSLAQLSRTKIALNQMEDAKVDAFEAKQMFEEKGFINGKQINLLNLSRINFEEGKCQDAHSAAIEAIEIAKQIKDDTAEIKGYKMLATIFKKKGQFDKALEYYELYSNIQDEFVKVQRSRHNLDMEIRHAIREKQKEIELLTKENEYQSQLIEKGEQITRQNEELLRVNDDLKQFAYIASHDLKEPLRMIGSFTQVIEKLAKPHIGETEMDYFRYVNEGVNRMNNLLDGLLRYSTVNQSSEGFTEISLNDVFNLSLANLKIRIIETQAVIERGELPVLPGTQSLYLQLFQNLITNAIKFVKPGTAPYVRVSSEETQDVHIIHVTDNGIGISESNQAKIFEIFKRLHHQSEYEGTGIGLAICQKIAKRLGGKITVKSKLGEGATFSLHLPKAKDELKKEPLP